MKLLKYRCGECGSREIAIKNAREQNWGMPWKDFPWVYLQVNLELPICTKCGNAIIPGELVETLNDALRQSIQKLTSDLIDQIKDKYGLTLKEIGHLTGVTPQYMSMLVNLKKVPSYQFVRLVQIISTHPDVLSEMTIEWAKFEAF